MIQRENSRPVQQGGAVRLTEAHEGPSKGVRSRTAPARLPRTTLSDLPSRARGPPTPARLPQRHGGAAGGANHRTAP